MTYQASRDAETKVAIQIYDFPDLQTRFVTRRFAGISTPGGWALFVGAVPEPDAGDQLDIRGAQLTVGGTGFTIADVDELLGRIEGRVAPQHARHTEGRVRGHRRVRVSRDALEAL